MNIRILFVVSKIFGPVDIFRGYIQFGDEDSVSKKLSLKFHNAIFYATVFVNLMEKTLTPPLSPLSSLTDTHDSVPKLGRFPYISLAFVCFQPVD